MLELLKALAPLIVELMLFIVQGSKEQKEQRRVLREEIVDAVRGGDVSAVNALANRLRATRKLRDLASGSRDGDPKD